MAAMVKGTAECLTSRLSGDIFNWKQRHFQLEAATFSIGSRDIQLEAPTFSIGSISIQLEAATFNWEHCHFQLGALSFSIGIDIADQKHHYYSQNINDH